ncbi:hypothetical protein Pelo_546 [Pelomyxa schiedti]|nr:hypothetical protein Pelo_546 [Pelomyxa schiedti]
MSCTQLEQGRQGGAVGGVVWGCDWGDGGFVVELDLSAGNTFDLEEVLATSRRQQQQLQQQQQQQPPKQHGAVDSGADGKRESGGGREAVDRGGASAGGPPGNGEKNGSSNSGEAEAAPGTGAGAGDDGKAVQRGSAGSGGGAGTGEQAGGSEEGAAETKEAVAARKRRDAERRRKARMAAADKKVAEMGGNEALYMSALNKVAHIAEKNEVFEDYYDSDGENSFIDDSEVPPPIFETRISFLGIPTEEDGVSTTSVNEKSSKKKRSSGKEETPPSPPETTSRKRSHHDSPQAENSVLATTPTSEIVESATPNLSKKPRIQEDTLVPVSKVPVIPPIVGPAENPAITEILQEMKTIFSQKPEKNARRTPREFDPLLDKLARICQDSYERIPTEVSKMIADILHGPKADTIQKRLQKLSKKPVTTTAPLSTTAPVPAPAPMPFTDPTKISPMSNLQYIPVNSAYAHLTNLSPLPSLSLPQQQQQQQQQQQYTTPATSTSTSQTASLPPPQLQQPQYLYIQHHPLSTEFPPSFTPPNTLPSPPSLLHLSLANTQPNAPAPAPAPTLSLLRRAW